MLSKNMLVLTSNIDIKKLTMWRSSQYLIEMSWYNECSTYFNEKLPTRFRLYFSCSTKTHNKEHKSNNKCIQVAKPKHNSFSDKLVFLSFPDQDLALTYVLSSDVFNGCGSEGVLCSYRA